MAFMAGRVPSCLKLDHNQTKIKLPLPTISGLQEEAVGAAGSTTGTGIYLASATLASMNGSVYAYVSKVGTVVLLGMLLDLDHEGPNPNNYLERHNLVDHDHEKHKLYQDLYMRLSQLLQLMLQWLAAYYVPYATMTESLAFRNPT
jgi:hypothetical protein